VVWPVAALEMDAEYATVTTLPVLIVQGHHMERLPWTVLGSVRATTGAVSTVAMSRMVPHDWTPVANVKETTRPALTASWSPMDPQRSMGAVSVEETAARVQTALANPMVKPFPTCVASVMETAPAAAVVVVVERAWTNPSQPMAAPFCARIMAPAASDTGIACVTLAGQVQDVTHLKICVNPGKTVLAGGGSATQIRDSVDAKTGGWASNANTPPAQAVEVCTISKRGTVDAGSATKDSIANNARPPSIQPSGKSPTPCYRQEPFVLRSSRIACV